MTSVNTLWMDPECLTGFAQLYTTTGRQKTSSELEDTGTSTNIGKKKPERVSRLSLSIIMHRLSNYSYPGSWSPKESQFSTLCNISDPSNHHTHIASPPWRNDGCVQEHPKLMSEGHIQKAAHQGGWMHDEESSANTDDMWWPEPSLWWDNFRWKKERKRNL